MQVKDLLERFETLPELVSLDLSGWREFINKKSLLNYIEYHPKLKYLGIVLNHVSFEPEFSENGCDLVIAGLGSELQIKVKHLFLLCLMVIVIELTVSSGIVLKMLMCKLRPINNMASENAY